MFHRIAWLAAMAAFPVVVSADEPVKSDASLAQKINDLVRHLGHDDFDTRQAAQEKLVELGAAILPHLERLEPFELEAGFRIDKIRIAVGGITEELRKLLRLSAVTQHESNPQRLWTRKLEKLIAEHPAKAGDFLLGIIANPKHELARPAVLAFTNAWSKMSAEQIRTYIECTFEFDFAQRPAYPRGVDAMIGVGYNFRHDWGNRSPAEKIKLNTVTTHTLDGQEYGKPYRYPYDSTGCTTAWVRTKDLALGKHTFTVETAFELNHNGETVKGKVKSPVYSFEMLPADTPDNLIAKHDPEIEKQVRLAVGFAETAIPTNENPSEKTDWWAPQITWTEKDGTKNGVHLPSWWLNRRLPVDLAFDVYLRIEGTKEEFYAEMLIAAKNTTRNLGYVYVRDAQALAKGRSGFVKVQVVLKPSRAMALTDPKVASYYPGEIVSQSLRIKVGPAEQK